MTVEPQGPNGPGAGAPPGGARGGAAGVEEVRTLRRWLWVVGAWAVAASVIAVVALLQEEERQTEPQLGVTTRLGALERKIEDRLEDIEKTLEGAASSDDVKRLERRVGRAEDDSESAVEAVRKLNDSVETLVERLDALESRVEELESSGGGGGAEGQN